MGGEDDRGPAPGTLANARYVEHIVHADVGQPQLLHLSAYVLGAGLLLSRWRWNLDQMNPLVDNGGGAVVDGLERLSDGWFLDHPRLEPVALSREQRCEDECSEEDAEDGEVRDHVTMVTEPLGCRVSRHHRGLRMSNPGVPCGNHSEAC